MPFDPTAQPINQPRRRDRQISDDAWIQTFLQQAPYGVIASTHEGQPFANTNLFVFDASAHAIYLHTARDGRTRFNLEHHPQVCFSVSKMGRLLPADTALEFSVEYTGVIIFGRAQVVSDEAEAERGLQLLLDKYFPHLHPGQDYRPIQPQELARTSVYRVNIESWSAKQKAAPEDFPGAFLFGEHDQER